MRFCKLAMKTPPNYWRLWKIKQTRPLADVAVAGGFSTPYLASGAYQTAHVWLAAILAA